MAIVNLIMPKMGESIMEATILKWLKQPGDPVKMDEPILEIATDKVDSEVPSTVNGILESILFQVNEVVPVGSVIAQIKTEAADPAFAPPALPRTPVESTPPPAPSVIAAPIPETPKEVPATAVSKNGSSGKFYSPLVLNIAANEGISMTELERIEGSGNEGRVTKKDILTYLQKRNGHGGTVASHYTGSFEAKPAANVVSSYASGGPVSGNVEILEMDRIRKLIAKHMVESKQTSAHVTSFVEADVTQLVQWRERTKADFEKRENEKITFTPLFIEALVKCLKKYPLLSSSVEGDRIIIKKDIHIGMATALPSGNLIVPVIKHADQFNLVGLTKQVNQLAAAARNNKLKPEDTSGGTFTFTNVGTFGSLMGTPIINQPQVAILAAGAIKKRPMVIETEQGDAIAIRHMVYFSMSYDHRIIDGALGATFLNAIAKELENFDTERSF